jgi:hypothetical protein
MSAYTKGPWIVEYDKEGAWEVASPNGSRTNGYLVVCSRKAHHLMADQMNANARLIAAAPELLEALQRIVNNPEARIGGDIRAGAIAAIAKAAA